MVVAEGETSVRGVPNHGRNLPARADVVVVGAGISGLTVALPLAKAGRHVVVLDRGEPWGDASGANAGTISVQVKRREVQRLTREAVELWRRMAEEWGIETGFGQPGGLRVATNARELERLRRVVAEQHEEGIDVELIDGNRLRDMAPWLGHDVRAAAHCVDDSYSSPLVTGHSMCAAARRLGIAVEGHAPVTAIASRGDDHVVTTPRGDVAAPEIVVAAGPWSGEITRHLGFTLPMQVDVNMMTVTEPWPLSIDKVVTHVGGILSLKQLGNGTCLIGGGWQGRGSVSAGTREIHHERLMHNLRVAARVVPALADMRIVRCWSGYEAVAPDALPVIGRIPGHARAWLQSCTRGGYSLAPALSFRLARMMLDRTEDAELARFTPRRLLS